MLTVLRQREYPIFGAQHLRVIAPGQHRSSEEKSHRWRAVGNTVSDLTCARFEPQTSRPRGERDTARTTGRYRASYNNHFC